MSEIHGSLSLHELFLTVTGPNLQRFEQIVAIDGFDPMHTVLMINGYEIRFSYTPSEMTHTGNGELLILPVGNVPQEILRTLLRYFGSPTRTIRFARIDGISEYTPFELE